MILVNTIIPEAVKEFEDGVINNHETHDEVIERCARERLRKMYEEENKELDRLVELLEKEVDFNNLNGVKRCVTKIFKILASNRRNLKSNIERLM